MLKSAWGRDANAFEGPLILGAGLVMLRFAGQVDEAALSPSRSSWVATSPRSSAWRIPSSTDVMRCPAWVEPLGAEGAGQVGGVKSLAPRGTGTDRSGARTRPRNECGTSAGRPGPWDGVQDSPSCSDEGPHEEGDRCAYGLDAPPTSGTARVILISFLISPRPQDRLF